MATRPTTPPSAFRGPGRLAATVDSLAAFGRFLSLHSSHSRCRWPALHLPVCRCCLPHRTAAPPPSPCRFYATLRRKTHPEGLLAGLCFTGFGLGDSNYTRYMQVPRAIKQRLEALGAQEVRVCVRAAPLTLLLLLLLPLLIDGVMRCILRRTF